MAPDNEVSVGLRVTKEGDTDAFKETAEEVQELETTAAEASPAVEKLGKGLGLSGEEAKKAAEEVGSLGESTNATIEKLTNVAGKALAMAEAFKLGWEAGTKLREGLNELTNDGLDRAVQSMADFVMRANGIDTGLDSAAAAAQRMANAARILKANGIDPTNLSLAEMDKKLEEVSRGKAEAAKAAEEAAKAEEKYATSLGLSDKALTESSKKLTDFIQNFAKANAQLADSDLGEIFKKPIQDLLDGFERIGKEAPKPLQDLARQFGVFSSSVEKESKRATEAVEDMVAGILGQAKKLAPDLAKEAATIRDAFKNMTPAELDFGSEAFNRAKTILQQFVDASRAAGKQIPADIADEAASFGVLVGAMEVAGGGVTSFAGAQKDLGGQVVSTTQVFTSQGVEISRVSTVAKNAAAGMKEAGQQIKEGADTAGQGAKPIRDVGGEIEAMVAALKKGGSTAKEAGGQIKEGTSEAGEGAAGLADTAAAGKEVGAGLSEAASGAEKLGPAADAATTGVEALKSGLTGMADPATTAKTALEGINTIKFDGIKAELASLGISLEGLVAKAQAAAAAITAIDTGEAPTVPFAGGEGHS